MTLQRVVTYEAGMHYPFLAPKRYSVTLKKNRQFSDSSCYVLQAKRVAAAAAATFNDSQRGCVGMLSSVSQSARKCGGRPNPSLPSRNTAGFFNFFFPWVRAPPPSQSEP